ncbi:MAG TPA: cation diffusion facilitator family transporter [Solirubrobacterales bacterium]
MGHSHVAHAHQATAESDRARLWIALAVILSFMAVEVVAGIVANSLALLSDAAHMLTDAAAIGLALVALRLSRRPPGGAMTFGLKRVEILSAQINGVGLLVLAALIAFEGVRRLFAPPGVEGGLVLVVAVVGIGVSLAATLILAGANRRSLNIEGSYQHILADLWAFIGTAVAGAVIVLTGFDRADSIASLVVAALMLRSSYGLLRESGRVFLEAAPKGIDPERIGRRMAEQPGVVEVHDLHVWEVTSQFPALAAHVTVERDADCHMTRLALAELLKSEFDIHHSTLQVEHEPERLLQIEESEPDR